MDSKNLRIFFFFLSLGFLRILFILMYFKNGSLVAMRLNLPYILIIVDVMDMSIKRNVCVCLFAS